MNYSEDFIQKMWETASSNSSRNANIWRKDKYQAWINRDEYNRLSEYGWKIYQNPFFLDDYIVFHWQNMTERTENGEGWVWKIKASGDKNVPYKGSCYVATLCYGDILAPEVVLFRNYRDRVLNNHFLGRSFIAIYYFVSPFLCKILKDRKFLNEFIRKQILDKLLHHINDN